MTISVRPLHHESGNQEFLTILQTNLPSLPRDCRFQLRAEAAHVVAYAKPQSVVSEFLQKGPIWSFSQVEIGA
ncbi:MAG: hypothetical protein WBE24_19945, partial [Candidatus Acidiferrum sp.]